MQKSLPFNEHVAEYEEWFEKYPYVFRTEVAAIKKIWPAGKDLVSLEVGSGTGRFAEAIGISCGLEPSAKMDAMAEERGIETMRGVAEEMPYQNEQFNVVLMNFCISYFENLSKAFTEAYRVLKPGAAMIVGFIDKYSRLGQYYESKRNNSVFYKDANYYGVNEVEEKLEAEGFKNPQVYQTLFSDLDSTITVEPLFPGHGQGSYILIKAIK
jgi:ubiquinone/menaquinone biosynthesis C-methylase UbiE